MKKLYNISLLAGLSLVIFVASCDKKEDVLPTQPTVASESGLEGVSAAVNEKISVNIIVSASAGLKRFEVKKDTEDFDLVEYADQFREEYELNYTVPSDAETGSQIVFSLQSTDALDRNSEVFQFTVTVEDRKFSMVDGTLHGVEVIEILPGSSGVIRFDLDTSLTAEKPYYLTGPAFLINNSTLTIEAGVIIYAKSGSNLVVSRGTKIMAAGTQESPIVFTSENVISPSTAPSAGDWGGILVLGDAATNLGEDIEVAQDITFGGSNDADNSGELSYTRIEYAGEEVIAGYSTALSMYAVGSETVVHHVQTIHSSSEGIRMYGGTVNANYLISVKCLDHAINLRHGYRGNGQYWVTQSSTSDAVGDPRAIDVRNDPNDVDGSPRTNPILSNITLVGPGLDKKDAGFENRGLRIRQGAAGKYHNFLITQFPDDALRVDDVDASMVVTNGHSWDNDDNFAKAAGPLFDDPTNKLFDTAVGTVTANQWVGSTSTEALDASMLGAWFDPVSFIGAIESDANDWTKGWSKNEDDSIR